MLLDEIPTPALLLDRVQFRANCDGMREKAARSRVAFRPHVKTHKTIEGAKLQHGGERGPITVSTLAEAEFFADAGFDDITYAVPIDPGKLDRAADLSRRIRLQLLIDSAEALAALEERGSSLRVRFRALLKVDSGAKRAGVDPTRPESIDLARRMARSEAIAFEGFLTHAGHSYACSNPQEIRVVAEEEARVLTELRRATGLDRARRSIGATPTASVVDRFPDTDEVRPGNYVFYDAFQAAIGSCSLQQCSASVLVSVISFYPAQNKLIVDGGALAFSKDGGPTHIDPAFGYGIVCTPALEPLPLRLVSMSQEHGQIFGTAPIAPGGFPIGSKLRIIPNHSCLTAALFPEYLILEKGKVVDRWRPARGW